MSETEGPRVRLVVLIQQLHSRGGSWSVAARDSVPRKQYRQYGGVVLYSYVWLHGDTLVLNCTINVNINSMLLCTLVSKYAPEYSNSSSGSENKFTWSARWAGQKRSAVRKGSTSMKASGGYDVALTRWFVAECAVLSISIWNSSSINSACY